MSLRRTQMCLRRILVSLRRTQMCLHQDAKADDAHDVRRSHNMGQICGKRARAPDAGVCSKALPSTAEVTECPNCGVYLLVAHRPVDNAYGYRLRCACGRETTRGSYSDLEDDYDHQE